MAEWMNDLQKKQWRTFTRNRIAVIGMFLSLGMLLMAVFAPQLSPFDPLAQDIHMRLHAPDGPFVLGTDDFGRDVLSRIFWGARISLTIGIGSVLFGMVLGSAMGMLAGLRGGRLGAFIMRCADTMMCFPAEILAILILVVLGQGVDKMLITIGLVMTPRFARLSYGSTLALREREFIEADLALGASTLYVLRQGILPNIMGELLVMSSLWAATAIRVEANPSFLGMGVSTVVGAFEGVVAVLPVVICFQSLILDMAGNVGTQSLAVTIRVLMDEKLSAKDKLHLTFKEMKVGTCNGALLGIMALVFLGAYIALFKGYAIGHAFLISGCVGISLLVAIVISSLVGTLVPILFHKIKVDPAVASGPLITTVNDLVAVVTYYGLAWILLIQLLHIV